MSRKKNKTEKKLTLDELLRIVGYVEATRPRIETLIKHQEAK